MPRTPAAAHALPPAAPLAATGLALDAGGTQCRWALAAGDGRVLAEGRLPGFGGAQAVTPRGRAAIAASLLPLREALAGRPAPRQVWGGVTGLDDAHAEPLAAELAQALGLDAAMVQFSNDLVLACRALWAPGEGFVLVAGTGAIAGYVDEASHWHRAGGRGVVIDDAGGGHWIAVQALRQVWRAEDAEPGAWRRSLLAQRLFDLLGGPDWADTRRFMVQADRGRVGRLALAVAEAAEADHHALRLLQAAGRELARLPLVLQHRFGQRPLALAGRVWALHPAVLKSFCAELPEGWLPVQPAEPVAPVAARRAAAGERFLPQATATTTATPGVAAPAEAG